MIYQQRIRALREEHGFTQQKLATVLHITQACYSRYECGVNMLPMDQLIALCEFYGVSSDYILGLSDHL